MDPPSRRPETASHAFHTFEQRLGETPVAKQMIVEEIEMAARQALDFGQRIVDALRVEPAAAFKEGILVAEVAMLRAAARHHDRVWHEIVGAADEIAAQRRNALECAARGRGVNALRLAGAEVDARIGGRSALPGRGRWCRRVGRFVRKRSDMQPAETNKRLFAAVVVGDAIGAVGVGDINLDQDEIRVRRQ